MIAACETYLTERLEALLLMDGYTAPFRTTEPNRTIFFGDLPRDMLKDNDYAVSCLQLRDVEKKAGRLIRRQRVTGANPHYVFTRRRYDRELTYRCFLYAPAAELPGLVEQLKQGVAEHKFTSDSDGSSITIDPLDAARPWDSSVELERKLDRSPLCIVRIQFTGGIQTMATLPIIPDITINPHVGGNNGS